ncbi:MAG: cold shock and DUF1294 domain-containing protein [Gallionella sp.]|nr:cold shock and DUF1294 domain-containing protein [Gallionella sp.]MDD4959112.1 cold shock and DUF1294 domain-containing protein [Gallionella sp.]
MRYQGKIINWKDDQGYGFVIQNGSIEKSFVHIKAFTHKARRPVEGDLIIYTLTRDEHGRLQASDVQFVANQRIADKTNTPTPSIFPVIFPIAFCGFLIGLFLSGQLPVQVLYIYLGLSVLTFFLYAIDKSAAQNNEWRTKESTLHFFAMIGGWLGALLAQKLLRHKSKKAEFQTVFWATVVINCCALGWLVANDYKLI